MKPWQKINVRRARRHRASARERNFQSEIQEARASDLHFFTNIGKVELRHDIGGKLARIEFSRFGQGHQSVALVVAKFRIARADENGGDIGLRQDGADGGLQL